MRARPALVLVLALALAACGRRSSRQEVSFAHLTFELPDGWSHHDASQRGVSTEIWTPSDNGRKESLTVIRSELAPLSAHADPSALGQLLESAQAELQDARVSQPTVFKTASGMTGVRIVVSYLPPGQHERYQRVHVVLVDGTSLVHVLYTAQSPDPRLVALDAVLGTLREGEG